MTELEKLFTQNSNHTSSTQSKGAEDEDWANVTLPSRTREQAIDMAPTAMPSLDELPRPEMLFAAQTPYHLIVKIVHNGMVVQGSHQGSLELLAGYLQKYIRDIQNISISVSCALKNPSMNLPLPRRNLQDVCLFPHSFRSSNASFKRRISATGRCSIVSPSRPETLVPGGRTSIPYSSFRSSRACSATHLSRAEAASLNGISSVI